MLSKQEKELNTDRQMKDLLKRERAERDKKTDNALNSVFSRYAFVLGVVLFIISLGIWAGTHEQSYINCTNKEASVTTTRYLNNLNNDVYNYCCSFDPSINTTTGESCSWNKRIKRV